MHSKKGHIILMLNTHEALCGNILNVIFFRRIFTYLSWVCQTFVASMKFHPAVPVAGLEFNFSAIALSENVKLKYGILP